MFFFFISVFIYDIRCVICLSQLSITVPDIEPFDRRTESGGFVILTQFSTFGNGTIKILQTE